MLRNFLTILFLLIAAQNATAQEIKKLITEEVKVNGTIIEINNSKSANINLLSWEGKNLKIVFESRLPGSSNSPTTLASAGIDSKEGEQSTIIKVHKQPNDKPQNNRNEDGSLKAKISFYIPKGKKLRFINTSNVSTVNLLAESECTIEMNGGTLIVPKNENLSLKAIFADIQLGNIQLAGIDINGGQLSITRIDSLTIISRYTQPKIESAGSINMTSLADNFTIDEIGSLTGTKTYGSCVIRLLKKKIDLINSKAVSVQVKEKSPQAKISIDCDNCTTDFKKED